MRETRTDIPQTMRIYPYRVNCFECEAAKIEEWATTGKLRPRNKELILQFQNYLFAKPCGTQRVSKVSSQLRRVALALGKDLDKASRMDLQGLIAYYNQQEMLSLETRADYRRCIKQFYRWFKDEDARLRSPDKEEADGAEKAYRYLEKEVKRSCKLKDVDFSNILTDEDIDKVIDRCRSPKQKAFLKLLHETGCRVGEFLNIRLKDITIMQNRAMITVTGKTGERRIPVVHSLPYLVQWLAIHEQRNNPEAYIWVSEAPRRWYRQLEHGGGKKLIREAFRRAGMLHKKHNFHWFRHSRATLLAPTLSESLLCKYMGWMIGSNQTRRYVHLCTEQLENAILEMNGLKDEEKKQSNKPQQCVCGTINTNLARYCYKCGKPLSLGIAIQDEEILKNEIDDRLKVYAEVMADPLKRQQFEEFKKLFMQKA